MTFDAPPSWQEKTILTVAAPRSFGEEAPPSVVVVREPLPPGETLLDFVHRHLAELQITPREAHFVDLDGCPAYQVSCEFYSEREVVERTTCFIETRTRTRAVVTHISTMCAKADAPLHRATFDAILCSVRFDRAVPTERTPLPSSPPPMSSEIRWNAPPPAPPLPDIPIPGSRARR